MSSSPRTISTRTSGLEPECENATVFSCGASCSPRVPKSSFGIARPLGPGRLAQTVRRFLPPGVRGQTWCPRMCEPQSYRVRLGGQRTKGDSVHQSGSATGTRSEQPTLDSSYPLVEFAIPADPAYVRVARLVS